MQSREYQFDRAREHGERIEENLGSSLHKHLGVRMRGKCEKVPDRMRGHYELKRFYCPTLIPIGPFHWKEPYSEQGYEYKRLWTAMYLRDTDQTYDALFQRVYASLLPDENCVLHFYDEIDIKSWEIDMNEKLMLVDEACSILHVLEKSLSSENPEKELLVSTDKLVRVHQDLLLLPNQLPYQFLKFICNDTARFQRCLHNFLVIHGVEKAPWNELSLTIDQAPEEEEEPLHLLAYLRMALLRRDESHIHKEVQLKKTRPKSFHFRKYRIGTIRELKAAGIKVTKWPHSTSFYPYFDSTEGKLELPEITVDGSTVTMFLNLMAYEMCPTIDNDFEISSFIVFMSSLIDQPEDVKELRHAGIIRNELANDKEVADLFNKMDYVLVPETTRFAQIRDHIEQHFESNNRKIKVKGWMVEAYDKYFRSPWAIIGLLAAILGLTLTFIQTWYAMHPQKGS